MTNSKQSWVDAVKVDPDFVTMQTFPANASNNYEINFSGGYLSVEHIKAFRLSKDGDKVDLDVTLVGTNTVKVSPSFDITDTEVTIYRDTPKDLPIIKFEEGALITARNLDTTTKQAIFGVAEMVDRFQLTTDLTDRALEIAKDANDTAKDANSKADTAVAEAGRALRFPVGETAQTLPPREERKNTVMTFDSNGEAITAVPQSGSAADVMIQLAKPTGAAKIGYHEEGTVAGFLDKLRGPNGSNSIGFSPTESVHAALERSLQGLGNLTGALSAKDGLSLVGAYNSYAELREATPTQSGALVLCRGKAVGTSDGFGVFRAVSGFTGSDDGAVRIAAQAGWGWIRVGSASTYHLSWFENSDSDFGIVLRDLFARLSQENRAATLELPQNAVLSQITPVDFDISRLQLRGNGSTVVCAHTEGGYAYKMVTSNPAPYGSPIGNKTRVSISGVNFQGINITRNSHLFNFEGTTTSKLAHWRISDCVFTGFDTVAMFKSYCYMFDFTYCVFSRNKNALVCPSDAVDSGERMTFTGCDFTSNLDDPSTLITATATSSTWRFINCSFDWMWSLGVFSNAQVFFNNCHLESPSANMIKLPTSEYCYLKCNGTTMLNFSDCFCLWNYRDPVTNLPFLIYTSAATVKVHFSHCHFQSFGIQWLATGPGLVTAMDCDGYNEFVNHFGLSRSGRANQVNNGYMTQAFVPNGGSSTYPTSGAGIASDDMTFDSSISWVNQVPGTPQAVGSVKMYNRFSGAGTSHTFKVPVERNKGMFVIESVVHSNTANIVQSIKTRFIDMHGGTVYTDTDTDAGASQDAGQWGRRFRRINLIARGQNLSNLEYVEVEIVTAKGNNTQFNLGTLVVHHW